MKILLTGGAGFIGRHVHTQLLADGHEVRVLDSLRSDVHQFRPAIDGMIVGDIRDAAVVSEALRGVDAVVHLAAKVGLGVDLDDMDDYVSTNSLGTAVLLRAMGQQQVRRLVYASSMVVYGEGYYECDRHGAVAPGPRQVPDLESGRFEPPCPICSEPLRPGLVSEDAPADPRNTYAATKLHGEHLAATWAREISAQATALRFHNVYGPGMPRNTPYAGVAAIFRSMLERGEPPKVYEDGGQRRDFIHVADIATAVATATAASHSHSPSPSTSTSPSHSPSPSPSPSCSTPTSLSPSCSTSPSHSHSTSRSISATTSQQPSTRPTSAAEGSEFTAYNVGSGVVRTIGDLAAELSRAYGGPAPITTGAYRLGDVRHITASSEKLRDELHWKPDYDLRSGLEDLLKHG